MSDDPESLKLRLEMSQQRELPTSAREETPDPAVTWKDFTDSADLSISKGRNWSSGTG